MSAGANVWSAAFPQAKSEVGGLVCTNVYVNKVEGVVKVKDVLPVA
jgi:hypothetical protein